MPSTHKVTLYHDCYQRTTQLSGHNVDISSVHKAIISTQSDYQRTTHCTQHITHNMAISGVQYTRQNTHYIT